MSKPKYCADLYLRLSKEDGDKEEKKDSNSITNQKNLLLDFMKTLPDVKLHKIRVDDGYTGVNFDRPAFLEMMEDVKSGTVNCVIVKDFSRFGRNHIEAGKYIEVLFKRSGIRFIAVNDHYDSMKSNASDNIIVPFKNMINDAYSADISTKVRSQFETKRRRGDFVGAFATYGYLKDPQNKNQLIIDEYAAGIVKNIFKWKIAGMSQQGIGDKLNQNGILSPMEYKRFIGMRFTTSFKLNYSAKWSAVAIRRILKNEIYLGLLEQGKWGTPNYKIKSQTLRPKEEWIRVENTHQAIISTESFETVQRLLLQDTHIASKRDIVYPFSGFIVCGTCGSNMVRKQIASNKKTYCYYTCSKHKKDKYACSSHILRVDQCEQSVLYAIQTHISAILDMKYMHDYMDSLPYQQDSIRNLEKQIQQKQEEIKRCEMRRIALYEDYEKNVIPKEDFIHFRMNYDIKMKEAKAGILQQKTEIEQIATGKTNDSQWIHTFKKHRNIQTVDRKILAELVETIQVQENKQIQIQFRYQNEWNRLLSFAQKQEVG